ncbi:uncharacterized protein LOC128884465 [Hylaeus volcanicus]|uniref:uncharacterized protein LOC128884465 n=1 Tax=Hylaeus volcanicus TaxID=313075 RepID=UPI0023B77328|nr:uncharacterized protein LOC128884465 [Hylaeus volcanicus]
MMCLPKIRFSIHFLEIGVVKKHNDIKNISSIKTFKYQRFQGFLSWMCSYLFFFILLRIDDMQILVYVSESFLTKEHVKEEMNKGKYETIQRLEEGNHFITSFFKETRNKNLLIESMVRGIVFQIKCRVVCMESMISCHKTSTNSISCDELQSQCYITTVNRDSRLFKLFKENLIVQECFNDKGVFCNDEERKVMPTIFCVMNQWTCSITKKIGRHCLWKDNSSFNQYQVLISFLNEKTHFDKNINLHISMVALARLFLYSSYYRKIIKKLKEDTLFNADERHSNSLFSKTLKSSYIVWNIKCIRVILEDEQLPRFFLYEAEDVTLTKKKWNENNCFEYKNSSASMSIIKKEINLPTVLPGSKKSENDYTKKLFFKKLKQMKEMSEPLACITGIGVTMRETRNEKTLNTTYQVHFKISQIIMVYLPYGLIFWLQQVVHVYDLFRFFQKETTLKNIVQHNVGNCIRYSCGICHETFGSSKCHSGFRLCFCNKCNVENDFHTYENDTKMGVHPTLPKDFLNVSNIKRFIREEGFDSQFFFKNFCKGLRIDIDILWFVSPYSEFTLLNKTTLNEQSKELLILQATQIIFETSPLTKFPLFYLKTCTVFACDGIPSLSSASCIQIPKKLHSWLNDCSNVSKQFYNTEPVVCFKMNSTIIVYSRLISSNLYRITRPLLIMDLQHIDIVKTLKMIHGVWMVLEMITKDTFFFKKQLFLTKEFFPASKSLYSCDITLQTESVTLLPSKKTKMFCETLTMYRDSNSKTTSISVDHALISTSWSISELSYIKMDKLSFWSGCCVLSRQESLKDLQNFIHVQENVMNGFAWTVYHKKIHIKNLRLFVNINHSYHMLKEEFFLNFLEILQEGFRARPLLEHYVCEKPKAWLYDTYNVLPELDSPFHRISLAIQNGLLCFLYSDAVFQQKKGKVVMGLENGMDDESSRQVFNKKRAECHFPNDSFWGCFGTPLLMISVESCFLQMQNPLLRVDAVLSKKMASNVSTLFLASHTLKGLTCSGFNVSISQKINSLPSPTKMCCCFLSCSTLGLLDHRNSITDKRSVVHNLYIEQSDFLHIEISGPLFSIVHYLVQKVFPLVKRWWTSSKNRKRCIDSSVREEKFRTNLSFHISGLGVLWKTVEIDMKEGLFIHVPLASQQTIIDPETCLINIQKNIFHLTFCQEMDDQNCVLRQTWNLEAIIYGPSGLASSSCEGNKNFACQQPFLFKIKSMKEHWKLLYKWTWYKRFLYKESIVIPKRECSFVGSLINIHPSTLFHLIYYLTSNEKTNDHWNHDKSFDFKSDNSYVKTHEVLKIQKEFNVKTIVHYLKIRLGMFRMNVLYAKISHHSNFPFNKAEEHRPNLSHFIFENNIETSCIFKACSLASEYERQTRGRMVNKRYGSFLYLPHVPPCSCDKLVPLIRISILYLGLQKKQVQVHIEKCQLSFNVLTIPSLLGNFRPM